MEFKTSVREGCLIISLSGDLIGEDNGLDIMAVANDEIGNGTVNVIVDISEVRYINSTGIGVLITLLTKFRNKGGEMYLLKPSESVQKLLIITKLNAIFNIVDTAEEALEKISKS